MRSVFNLDPKYRVTMLTREDWTNRTGAPPAVKGHIWFTDGSKMREGTGTGVYRQSVGRRLSFPLGRVRNSLPGRNTCYLGLCT
jgi:hypothetical protein